MEEPIRLPPTVSPKPKTARRRWVRPTGLALFIALGLLAASLLANHEVSKRFATTVVSPTTSVTINVSGVTAAPPTTAPRRASRRATTTTTELATTTTVEANVTGSTMPTSDIIVALDKLGVADEHPDGYRVARFGLFRDDDHDNCNTREEILIRYSTVPVSRQASCRITAGRWVSPYDGVVATDPHDVSLDHIATIREAWESGAWRWTDQQRNDYLNDLDNVGFLLVVSDAVKGVKGDKDPGEWLPPLVAYKCDYLRGWVAVKTFYKLTVDPGEREAIAAAAIGCTA